MYGGISFDKSKELFLNFNYSFAIFQKLHLELILVNKLQNVALCNCLINRTNVLKQYMCLIIVKYY